MSEATGEKARIKAGLQAEIDAAQGVGTKAWWQKGILGPPYETVIYETDHKQKIAWVVFNRPERLNAESDELRRDVMCAIHEAERDDEVKVIIIKGSGRAFCPGADLKRVGFRYGFTTEAEARRPSQRRKLYIDQTILEKYFETVLFCQKPTIAQVHGYAVGGGTIFQMCCDISIAAEDATLGFIEQRMGFFGAGSKFQLMVYLLGHKVAKELLYTSKLITAKEAERIGLINRAVPADKLEEEVMKVAKEITLMPRDGIAMGKAYTNMAYDCMGISAMLRQGAIGHSFFTNIRWEPDEYNFYRERRERGPREAIHARNDRYNLEKK